MIHQSIFIKTIFIMLAASIFHYPDCCLAAYKRTVFFPVGTGDVTGLYYPVGGIVTQLVNPKLRAMYRVRLSVQSTEGSVSNID